MEKTKPPVVVPTPDSSMSAGLPGQVRALDIYVKGRWERGTWAGLKKDMIFRVIEPDQNGKERIADLGTDHEVSIAVEDARREPSPAFWCVKREPFTFVTPEHPLASRIRVVDDAGIRVDQVFEMNVPMGIVKIGTGHPLQWDGRMMSGVHVDVIPGVQVSAPEHKQDDGKDEDLGIQQAVKRVVLQTLRGVVGAGLEYGRSLSVDRLEISMSTGHRDVPLAYEGSGVSMGHSKWEEVQDFQVSFTVCRETEPEADEDAPCEETEEGLGIMNPGTPPPAEIGDM